jgi:[glutamine synthetase] adenylyltransferase / [glutamine synthetase]-adenylyl-L-tyrosine phosphorylase
MVATPYSDWPANYADAAARATRHAPFLKRLLRDEATFAAHLSHMSAQALFDAELAALADPDIAALPASMLKAKLRETRGRLALLTALADLAGDWPLETVTANLSAFADCALGLAVEAALTPVMPKLKRFDGQPITGSANCGLAVFALGKHGGSELNYSSDLDLVCFFDEQVVGDRDGQSPIDLFIRVVQQMVAILQERTAEGYCLRVDLRLRPDPNATPVALSMAAAETYYHSLAMTWERAAWTRARACAGDLKAGDGFLKRLAPWVWRRSFDYSAVRDLHDIKRQIEAHFGQEEATPDNGFDVKRGIGGLRDIEFMVQLHQLIAGGRTPTLRHTNTLGGLKALADAGLEPAKRIEDLSDAYRFWRTLEHRLQMLHDEQTHVLPRSAAARKDVAGFMGLASRAVLDRHVAATARRVHTHYRRFLGPVGRREDARLSDSQLDDRLAAAHLPASALQQIDAWRRGRVHALRTPRARDALDRLLPAILDGLGKAADPTAAFHQFDEFLSRLPAGVQLLEILEAHPPLLMLLLRVIALAPPLARQLARSPALIDAILARPLDDTSPGSRAAERIARGRDLEDQLSLLGQWLAEERFRLSVQLVERVISPDLALARFADLADQSVAAITQIGTTAFAAQHGIIKGSVLIVLALGGWGGGQLLPGSDLDLVFLFSGPHDKPSNGARALPATHYFNRLAQRLVTYLSAGGSEGALYEVDTRLRPSGTQGLLAVTAESFLTYQRSDAWTWEHQALTRARRVLGPDAGLSAGIHAVLMQHRDSAALRKDILSMRADMDKHRPPSGPLDLKLSKGGLIDIEFLLQALQLHHGAAHPGLLHAHVPTAIAALADAGILSARDAEALAAAQRLQLSLRLLLGLCRDDPTAALDPTSATASLVARALGAPKWRQIETRLAKARTFVRSLWHQHFDQSR